MLVGGFHLFFTFGHADSLTMFWFKVFYWWQTRYFVFAISNVSYIVVITIALSFTPTQQQKQLVTSTSPSQHQYNCTCLDCLFIVHRSFLRNNYQSIVENIINKLPGLHSKLRMLISTYREIRLMLPTRAICFTILCQYFLWVYNILFLFVFICMFHGISLNLNSKMLVT